MEPFEALYEMTCSSPVGWIEVDDSSLLGLEIIYEALEKVRMISNSLKITSSPQKSYSDNRRKDLEFELGEMKYLKISPMKCVTRFDRKGKLNPRYVGTYEVLQRSERLQMS